jgi:nucleoid-associated protein YgaU
MTSDAKIGLLLGLVFIFIIAFIINGLPSFHKSSASGDINSNELTTNMVSLQNGPPALAAREHKAQEILNAPQPIQPAQPAGLPTAENTVPPVDTSAQIKTGRVVEVGPAAPAQPSPQTQQEQIAAAAERPSSAQKSEENLVKTYTVHEGDTLATVAKKCYGTETGNKKATIDALYNANRKSLKSPDDLDVGQKLIIPALSISDKNQADSVTASKAFRKVDSVGQKRQEIVNSSKPRQGGQYTVRQGDTLWKIAADQFGDGTRYKEIVKLNSAVLESEDNLAVGMTLKMPSR